MAYGTTPNGGLVTETNQEYYAGAQSIIAAEDQLIFQFSFDTEMSLGNYTPVNVDYQLNNFKLFTSSSGGSGTYKEYIKPYTVFKNKVTLIPGTSKIKEGTYITSVSSIQLPFDDTSNPPEEGDKLTIFSDVNFNAIINDVVVLNPDSEDASYLVSWDGSTYGNILPEGGENVEFIADITEGTYVVSQLKSLDGGNYGDKDAYGNTVEENYGSYAYVKVSDLVQNFMMTYVGAGKLIPSVKRTDVIFHTKRALQEFSYDTLKSIKSQELTVPPSLGVVIPQDYVNYVSLSWVDLQGVKHPIYPNHLYSPPYTTPVQDDKGVPTQDNFGENLQGTSQINKRWNTNDLKERDELYEYYIGLGYAEGDFPWGLGFWGAQWGQRYGLEPEYANINGWFIENEAKGTFTFSNDLVNKLILLEYISDGLAYDHDMKVPKMAEAAVYSYINHAVLSTKINTPEYLVNRYKKEKYAQLRNAKIRLSNIKPSEFVQIMRGKSKWIKH
tara:strand:- start:1582 stop:3075 length:1494 start_codon:yes stop_codon:yes gene_type:complete